jgi:3-methyl-2-oxobutanoate hydroxymethyltransferase
MTAETSAASYPAPKANRRRRLTIADLQAMHDRGEPIAMLTAYDYPTAKLADQAGIPLLLVGDSLGMVVLGYDSTLPVTVDDMVHHGAAVVRGVKHAHVVVDMPFGSYQTGWQDAMRNAARFIQETNCGAVKLEGGIRSAETVQKLVEAGIPVMGHIGLTPQSVNQIGGWKVQGKTPAAAVQLMHDAQALEQAGAFAVVLELVPAALAALLTERITIPTIGIGAGAGCDGQVQVFHDLLGMYDKFTPKHAGRYANIGEQIRDAVAAYTTDVRAGKFPTSKQSFKMDPAALAELSPRQETNINRRHALGLDA